VREWRALSWWEQRNYIEQLVMHGKYIPEDDSGDDGEIPLDALRFARTEVVRADVEPPEGGWVL
jgi:hypothetical protein